MRPSVVISHRASRARDASGQGRDPSGRGRDASGRHTSRSVSVLLALLLASVGGCGETTDSDPTRAPGSTLRATLVDRDGDGKLEPGPGEPLRARSEIGRSGSRGRPGQTLATFAQLTDLHIRDEESPARAPFLDRFGGQLNSTFRPHEALSAQVAAAAIRAVNAFDPQAVLVTGDIADSAQANELALARTLLDGGRARPDSGARGYDGVQAPDNPDPFYYRPDNDAPRHPGMLNRAQAAFAAPGLNAPWLPALGNHDVMVQGIVPPNPRLTQAATGTRAVATLDPGVEPRDDGDARAAERALLDPNLPARSLRVPADAGRRFATPPQAIRALGRPPRAGRLDYVADIGPRVRVIVLDTVRRDGGSRGIISPDQTRWLRRQAAVAGPRWIIVASHNPLDASDGGRAALAVLDSSPRVVAAIAGNRHSNVITPRRTSRGGYWLIGTSSLADFPQQARAFRLVEVAGGGVALETWMLDHDGRGLAGTARELAFLDAQGGRPQNFAGGSGDRNARLHLPPVP